jgi:hypothetical protein
MRKLLLLCINLTLTILTFAQVKISGTVVSEADGKPLGFASVFINNTTKGATTAENGTYTIKDVAAGKYQLIASYVGYETLSTDVEVINDNIVLKIAMKPKATVLKAFEVKRDPNREAYIKKFKETFIGKTINAKLCKITNDEILDIGYDKFEDVLKATTDDYLIIENRALGYRVRFLLKQYLNSEKQHYIAYYGYAFYENLPTKKKAQKKLWMENREKAYHGSSLHFFRTLIHGDTQQEGFTMNEIIRKKRVSGYIKDSAASEAKIMMDRDAYSDDDTYANYRMPWQLTPAELISQSDSLPDKYILTFNHYMLITYSKEQEEQGYAKTQGRRPRYQESMIRFEKPYCIFSKEGLCEDPLAMIFSGYWGYEKIAELVPYDYK